MLFFRKFLVSVRTSRSKFIVFFLVIVSFVVYPAILNPLGVFQRNWLPARSHTVIDNTLPLELAWSYTTNEALIVPPRMNSQVIVPLHGSSILTALDIHTGQTKWEYTLDSAIGVPESKFVFDLNEEYLVIVVDKQELLALDANSGHKIWQRELPVSFNSTSNVMLVENFVVVSAFSVVPSTEGYIASYRLGTGDFIAQILIPSRSFGYQLSCSDSVEANNSAKEVICITLYGKLWLVELDEERLHIAETYSVPLYSFDIPSYQDGFLFSNPSPVAAPQVYDIANNKEFDLPTSCSQDNTSHPVTSYNDLILISNGCNELYTMNISQLERDPNWVFRANEEIVSSFITIDGELGFSLNVRGEVVGVSLANGEETGRIKTTPSHLSGGQFRNNLSVFPPYLFAIMDGTTLLAFKQEP